MILFNFLFYFIHRYLHTATVFNDCLVTWEKAKSRSQGYSDPIILNKVKKNTLISYKNQNFIERDSVLIKREEIEYSFPLLFILKESASTYKNRLNIVDFGGSLGSTYFQYLPYLSKFKKIEWSIVEQKKYAELGSKLRLSKNLYFYDSLKECLADKKPNVAIFSSSLQYVEDPFKILEQISKSSVRYLLVDRIPYYSNYPSKISIQHVAKWIYQKPISYPSHIFNMNEMHTYLRRSWKIISEFKSLGTDNITSSGRTVKWGGVLYIRK